MVKTKGAKEKSAKDTTHTCSLCFKVIHNRKNVCMICATAVRKKKGPNASNFDKLLIQLLRNSKANLRSNWSKSCLNL